MIGAADPTRGSPGRPRLGAEGAARAEIPARSTLGLLWARLRGDRVALAALALLAVLALVAVLAPVVVDLVGARPPDEQSTRALDSFGTPTGPSRDNLFGVDDLGRDVFSRVVYGARVSLLWVALVATALSVVIGVAVGMAAGYFGGWVDTAVSRLVDLLLAFPVLLLAMGVGAACSLGDGCLGGLLEPGLPSVVSVIAFVNWTYIARIVRGQVLSLREQAFVDAARALVASDLRILVREILPNLVAPIVVYSTLIVPQNILFEAALSFLGVGVQPPDPSWGKMLAEATSVFDTAWWYMLFPGAALLLTVLSFNLLGDGLQDALDPRAGK